MLHPRCFYHQFIRRGTASIAYFVTYILFKLRKGGLVGRYVFISITFAVSGVYHVFSDITQQIPLHEIGAFRFFCMQALGIMFEDAAQAFHRYLMGNKAVNSRYAGKALGYVWVVLWLVWTTPVWRYPAMQRDKGEALLPFSLMSLLRKQD